MIAGMNFLFNAVWMVIRHAVGAGERRFRFVGLGGFDGLDGLEDAGQGGYGGDTVEGEWERLVVKFE